MLQGLGRAWNSLDEVNGVVEATLNGCPLLLALWRVTAEAEDVLDACFGKAVRIDEREEWGELDDMEGDRGGGRVEDRGDKHRSSWRP